MKEHLWIPTFSRKGAPALADFDAEDGKLVDGIGAVAADEVVARSARAVAEGEVVLCYTAGAETMTLVCSPRGIRTEGSDTPLENAPAARDACLHAERLWAIDDARNARICYSAALDPRIWTEDGADAEHGGGAGGFDLGEAAGKALRIFDFDNTVLVVCEHGFVRVAADADPKDFVVSPLDPTAAPVDGGTVCAVGPLLYYCAGGAVCTYDGRRSAAVTLSARGLDTVGATAAFSAERGGTYSIACKADLGAGVEPCVVCCETETGACVCARGLGAVRVVSVGGRTCVLTADGKVGVLARCGTAWGVPTEKIWRSGRIAFADGAVLKSLSVRTATPLTVLLRADGRTMRCDLAGSPRRRRIRLAIRCYAASVELRSVCAGTSIDPPVLGYETR